MKTKIPKEWLTKSHTIRMLKQMADLRYDGLPLTPGERQALKQAIKAVKAWKKA